MINSPHQRTRQKSHGFQDHNRWQKRGKRNDRIFRWLAKGFFLFFVLLCLFFLFIFWQAVSGSRWQSQGRINLAVTNEEEVDFISFDQKEASIALVRIPGNTRFEITRGYGLYPLASVAKLELQENKPGLLVESLQENLGLPVDGWLKVAGQSQVIEKKQLQRSLLLAVLEGKGETNLTALDLVRLWWHARGVRFDRFETVDLGKSRLLTDKVLADQTTIQEIDTPKLDERFQRLFFESPIREERLGVEILNGTQHPGLGEKAARLLVNIGGEVVLVGNSDQSASGCEISSLKSKQNTYTVWRLKEIYHCHWQEKKEEERADITLVIGEDYWQKLNEK